jgi:anti-anti-sigma factor
MDLTHNRVPVDRSARSDAVSRGKRDTKPRLAPAPRALGRLQPDRGRLRSVKPSLGDRRQTVAGSQLVVAWGGSGKAPIVWLSGRLDRKTGTVLDRELDPRAIGTTPLVIDLTGLEFIDTSGLHTLARVVRRATKRGDRLTLRHGQHVAQRPLGLIRALRIRSERAPRPEPPSDDDSHFAFAMANVDVDHPPW